MSLTIVTEATPLRVHEHGIVLVGNTRVPIDTVIFHFKQGATAEEIVERFSTLDLADVYAVIAYYLRHQDEVEAYLEEQEKRSQQIREQIEQRFPSKGLRERLLAKRAQKLKEQQESMSAIE